MRTDSTLCNARELWIGCGCPFRQVGISLTGLFCCWSHARISGAPKRSSDSKRSLLIQTNNKRHASQWPDHAPTRSEEIEEEIRLTHVSRRPTNLAHNLVCLMSCNLRKRRLQTSTHRLTTWSSRSCCCGFSTAGFGPSNHVVAIRERDCVRIDNNSASTLKLTHWSSIRT